MNGCDLMEELARLKEDRDRLIEEAKDLMRERDEIKQRLATEQIMNSELQHEAELAREERDDVQEYADCEKQFADGIKAERDEAREAARFFRDLYVSQVGRTYPDEYTFPWEDEHGADRDGC